MLVAALVMSHPVWTPCTYITPQPWQPHSLTTAPSSVVVHLTADENRFPFEQLYDDQCCLVYVTEQRKTRDNNPSLPFFFFFISFINGGGTRRHMTFRYRVQPTAYFIKSTVAVGDTIKERLVGLC